MVTKARFLGRRKRYGDIRFPHSEEDNLSGEVIFYKLSPEEIKKLLGGDENLKDAAKNKKDLTKGVYLKLISQGKNDAHIRKEYGISSWTALKRMKDAWGVTGESISTENDDAPTTVTFEKIISQLDELAAGQAEIKKQLSGIGEILTQLTKENHLPNSQFSQNLAEQSNTDQTVELIRALLKELL